VSILDRASGAFTEVYERGEVIGADAWDRLEAIVGDEFDRGDVGALAISGSLPPGAPPDGYARIARIAARVAVPVPVFADTYGPALAATLAERPAVVKVNAGEAGEAIGRPVTDVASALEATRLLQEAGAESVVVTLGGDGAVIAGGGGRAHLVPPDLRGSYPVGSGDAFLGGLVVAWGRGEAFDDAVRLGLAAAIANALIPGAGRLDRATAEEIVGQIRVDRI
jgi:fructose-1-phosphate kinase PfkB-like protein